MPRKPLLLLLASVRLARLTIHLVYALMVAGVYPAFAPRSQRRFRQRWSRSLLRLLNVRCLALPQTPLDTGGCLLVANHISWLDIFVINACVPAHFVAKSDVRAWPLLGWLVARSGTIFVQRTLRSDTLRVNASMAALMRQGHAVALFPQGTSTDGVLPVQFRASLLQCAVDTASSVFPVALRYHDELGCRLDAMAFVGDISFMESLWKIVCTPCIHVTVSCAAPIDCAGQSRRSIAFLAQHAVNASLATATGA